MVSFPVLPSVVLLLDLTEGLRPAAGSQCLQELEYNLSLHILCHHGNPEMAA